MPILWQHALTNTPIITRAYQNTHFPDITISTVIATHFTALQDAALPEENAQLPVRHVPGIMVTFIPMQLSTATTLTTAPSARPPHVHALPDAAPLWAVAPPPLVSVYTLTQITTLTQLSTHMAQAQPP